jgi:protein TonB
MEPLAILQTDMLDLLFENRNKLYGAYPLRKYYPQRLFISMGIIFLFVFICSFFYFHFQSAPVYTRIFNMPDPHIQTIDVDTKVKPVKPPPGITPPKPPTAFQHTTPVIVAEAPKPMATVEDLQSNAIGVKTLAGEPENGLPQNNENGTGQTGTAVQIGEPDENKPEIFDRAQIMPEFPGGIEALKRFLLKNLRMPDDNLEPGTQVRVMARFVVGADGRVRDIEITQPAGEVFNREIKRVISKMPDWKPGEQNHRRVAVYFSLPVNFVAAE